MIYLIVSCRVVSEGVYKKTPYNLDANSKLTLSAPT